MQKQVERPLEALDVDDEKVLLLEGTLGDRHIHSSTNLSDRPMRILTGQRIVLKKGG